jgi:hypothetical protein
VRGHFQRLSPFVLSVSLWAAMGCGSGSNGAPATPQNPAPALSSISPNSAAAGSGAFTLTATGTGFISSSLVAWNGTALATTYVSSTSLTAQVPASDLTSAGTASVTVQTPAPGGGTSGAISFTISAPLNPAPTLKSISPSTAVAGSAALTLSATGTGFISGSVVQWNGTALATTYISSTSLTAQVPASNLAISGTAAVAVQTPAPGGGTSSSVAFTVTPPVTLLNVLSVEGNDLAWNAAQSKLYVAVPSNASINPSTVTVVDPVAGTIASSVALASAPTGFAISNDDQYLYTVIGGGATIERLILPALTSDIQWSLGSGQVAGNIQVQPGAAHTLAASFGQYGSGSIAVYDDGVKRSAVAGGATQPGNSLQWAANGSQLYAAWGTGSDSPYYTTVSDVALYSMPVTTAGVGTVATYNKAFRREGVHLQLDPSTGYAYSDTGEVVNTSTGLPIGNYPASFPPAYGQLSVADPTLKRYYTLVPVYVSGGTAFQINVFDQTQFRLLDTMLIPNGVGTPTAFLRWGQAGLAFVTNTYSATTSGKLYLLDGNFVNPAAPADTTAGSSILPVPTLTAISPLRANAGAQSLTLTVTGRDFVGQPTVYWNGTALATTQLSATQLSAQIPVADLTAVTQAAITASNTSTGSPVSASLPFSVNPLPPAGNQVLVYNAGGNSLVWDSNAAKIYVSTPGIQGDSGDSLAVVDPVAETVSTIGFLGSDPDRLSIASGGQSVYVGLDGLNTVEQLTLPGFAVNTKWNLGSDSFNGPYYALDLEAAPAAAQTTAVTLANFDVSPSSAAVVIYDSATPRPTRATSGAYEYSSLQWTPNDATVFSVDQSQPQSFLTLAVTASGAALSQHYSGLLQSYSQSIHYDSVSGLIYTDAGQVVQPSSGTIVGSFGASGIVAVDSTLNRVFILGQTSAQSGTTNYTIESFNQTTFAPVGSITIANVVGVPTGFIRWGTNGLAFTTIAGYPAQRELMGPGQLYAVAGTFVNQAISASQPAVIPLLPVANTWAGKVAPPPQSEPMVVHQKPTVR